MDINYSNKLKGLSKKIENILSYIESESFEYNTFVSLVGSFENSFDRLSDSLYRKGLDRFNKICKRPFHW